LLTLLLASVLGGFVGAVEAAEEDKIVLALERDQDNMDPHMHFQRVGILMNINMYDSLLHKTPKLDYEPSLATWPPSGVLSTILPGSSSCARG
jgi:hypothetical protein